MEALLHEARTLSIVQVTPLERIYVSEEWGFNVDELPKAVCFCGTCRSPMERFSADPINVVIFCKKCGLRFFFPNFVTFKEILEVTSLRGFQVLSRGICGRCFGSKQIQIETSVGSGAKRVEFVSCPQCSH